MSQKFNLLKSILLDQVVNALWQAQSVWKFIYFGDKLDSIKWTCKTICKFINVQIFFAVSMFVPRITF